MVSLFTPVITSVSCFRGECSADVTFRAYKYRMSCQLSNEDNKEKAAQVFNKYLGLVGQMYHSSTEKLDCLTDDGKVVIELARKDVIISNKTIDDFGPGVIFVTAFALFMIFAPSRP